jgi:CIC family chloride channel protein
MRLPSSGFTVESLAQLRALIRTTEPGMIALAALIGVISGAIVSLISFAIQKLHELLFGLPPGVRLTSASHIDPRLALAVPVIAGILLGGVILLGVWRGWRQPIDPIEANALHGGRMSLRDSIILVVQNLISNGGGASVGLEAGYTQICGGIASRMGQWLRLRRADLRMVVGCGAAAGIAAAFNAPLAGAFYGFELILGTYSIATLAPVLTAALFSTFVMRWLIGNSLFGGIAAVSHIGTLDYFAFGALGLVCGLYGIMIMRGVSLIEIGLRRLRIPPFARPLLGGVVVGGLALISPMVLSSGHGAVHLNLTATLPVTTLVLVLGLKSLASSVSLGSGFRGGLFFARC